MRRSVLDAVASALLRRPTWIVQTYFRHLLSIYFRHLLSIYFRHLLYPCLESLGYSCPLAYHCPYWSSWHWKMPPYLLTYPLKCYL
jgi:hypothetical protein